MFKWKASSAFGLRQALLPRCCAVVVGVANCAGAIAADPPAYRYLDENGRAAYSQYPPASISARKVYTTTAITGRSVETPRPRYGDESRYAALRQDASPELEHRQAKIAAAARENKRAAEAAAECRRNHDIGCGNAGQVAAVNPER